MLADRFLPSPSSATLATAAKALGAVTSVKSGKEKVIASKGRYFKNMSFLIGGVLTTLS